MNQIELMMKIAWSYLGTFYRWGGDDPSGFDCSGFVIEVLKSVGLLPEGFDGTAQTLHDMFLPVSRPEIGYLAFRKNNDGKIIHVGIVTDTSSRRNLVIHASGGGSNTLTLEDAIKQNAFIKVRPVWKNAVYCSPLFFYAGTINPGA
jgi:cell wall-associated NlpC family hydrolase